LAFQRTTTPFANNHPETLSPAARRPEKKYRAGPKPTSAPLSVSRRSVQLDVKFVPRIGRARMQFHQFTAIDEATRFRVSRTYHHNNATTAIQFLDELRKHFPFVIQKIQADNDSSFAPQFT
jgi:hypothetical protein